jgi:heat-inducible transcriptional repressor
MAGMVMVPRHERDLFRQIEFLPLSGTRVLAILVTGEGEVHNRIIHTDKESCSPSQLVQAGQLSDRDLHRARHARGAPTPGR